MDDTPSQNQPKPRSIYRRAIVSLAVTLGTLGFAAYVYANPQPTSSISTAGPPSQNFTITGEPLGNLSPGSPVTVPLTLHNSNSSSLSVTNLLVTVSGSPAGCSAAQNIAVTQANTTTPIVVPGNSTVTLPTQGAAAPTIELLNLPTNQDACIGASWSIHYTGTAQ